MSLHQNDGDNPHTLLRPKIVLPFILVGLIWGSTWYVITGQIGDVPAAWSITWRFALACPAMFGVALAMGRSLKIGRDGHLLAIAIGFFQFAANFGFVYRAELHLTSGIVALMFGMLMIPNAILGWALLGQKVTGRFLLGGALAMSGIVLLLVHEAQLSRLTGNVTLGTALTIGGILAASIANVIQAGKVGRGLPMPSLLAWSILYGVIIDATVAWITAGPPVFPARWEYWAGVAWLAIAGSVVTFPLYYQIVREIGPGRAAYNGVLVVIVAMLISTFIEGYEWSLLAEAGAVLSLAGMVWALRARKS
ncbi:DMT family transporter [Pontixanthobacter aquaemixtae]|uniref:EamA family transporter n=1 Tax=Pontixanthobacter aquaemixtae TaxID=1958940 RepID=A0A844ZTU3_9SPHN|nr:DMT family transporter [Pontixanthobacter aquaemixtae]MXO91295.1 EamA family transporter [Pontixanthobacter aquaemixtae]